MFIDDSLYGFLDMGLSPGRFVSLSPSLSPSLASGTWRDIGLIVPTPTDRATALPVLLQAVTHGRNINIIAFGEKHLELDADSRGAANTTWVFATANHRDEKLLAALGRAAKRRLSEFHSQNVSNTAWAFATANYRDTKPFAALARAAERRLNEFHTQDVANTT